MLRISSLTPAQQRELRHWQAAGDPWLARRAQFVLWSARGWSVPALAHALGCCRRTVRRWLHVFLASGLAALQERVVDGESQREPTPNSATASDPPMTGDRLVPVVPISVPELRRILAFHWHLDPISPDFFWHWSRWRRYKQALAMRSHYQKRGAAPPEFPYVRL
jgi:hypothetical protein